MKKFLIDFYMKEQFRPSWFGIFINPFYFARAALSQAMKQSASELDGRLLDVGCGSKPYKIYINATEYIGLEVDSLENRLKKNADIFYDGKKFPLPDKSFNSVLANQVLEHIFEPDLFLSEANRILIHNGKILITVPFIWGEHEQPFDSTRYTSFGIRHLLEKHGFQILRQEKICGGVKMITQIWNANLYRKFSGKNNFINLLITSLLLAPFAVVGLLLSSISSKNPDWYLDNIILAVKKK